MKTTPNPALTISTPKSTSTPISMQCRQPYRLSLISICLFSAFGSIGTLAPSSVYAQESDAPGATVVINGQRLSLRKSIAAQEKADNIVSVISSDDIGGLPDKNAAEALARLPGVSVQRDQGEGRYITVRGIGADYNAVTINGALVPAPEASRRAVALDILPSGLIRTLEVTKTLLPEQDANSLGGTTEVKTLSAFDIPGKMLMLNAAANYDENTGKTSPNLGVAWADRFLDGKLGVALGISLEKREFGSDNVETGGAWTGSGKDAKLSGFELRDYLPVRERRAYAINLDFRPNPHSSYFLRSFQSDFSDDEVRDRLTISNISGGALAEGASASARGERRLRQRKYTQNISSVLLGTEQKYHHWTLDMSVASSKASDDTPEAINDARFRGTTDFSGIGFYNSQQPSLVGPASLYDPASFSLNAITLQQRLSQDSVDHAKVDLARKFHLEQFDSTLKFGAKSSRREKTNDTNQWLYNSSKSSSANYWGAGSPALSSFVQETLDYKLGRIGQGINPALIRSRVAGLNRDAARQVLESNLNDYTMHENIDSAYLQNAFDTDTLHVLAGVRMEKTNFDANGSEVSGTKLQVVQRDKAYTNWLPSLQTRYELDQHTSLRAGWTNAVVRANFSQLAPGINLSSNTEAVIGNPDLKPLKAASFDIGVERILGSDGSISAYLFYKDIKDFTYSTNLAGTGKWLGYTSASSYANGDAAKVKGIELSYTQTLSALPAPWNGLLFGVNTSLSSSSANVSRYDSVAGKFLSRSISLPSQSDQIVNLMLGYEQGPLSTRLALNYKSAYLLEMGSDILKAEQDRMVDAQK